uniref:V-type proton ATPase subunit n=1 Tax=Chromera velia CCMP2878 TaxID=1169474 RepID=A0A0G4HWD5_9ALVE|mmetsp:Transcript_44694/g.88314  ORF Transcript_44694/g.88314 Transcript_44694/m.88314 type:complete len:86 (-) Transcript_44694:232-489(-)|eukprot:Cvel_32612.t1-p1 / transcript=Cvel_32612.t1 / gene=Cvel_32612 / organism=Chromera_velia_CCMP2878 / gene_product=hypothetical protein / transcript_product=hypothetical protein / location=Cvel_scaffold5114:2481-2965(-) / protein_length=85 / sequence_SO=supercontig / SO=protein_coding / is_pseudo=false
MFVIWVGSLAFVALGVAGCIILPIFTVKDTPNVTKKESCLLTLILTVVAVVCLWMFWICMYLHQLNPLISPKHRVEDEHAHAGGR